MKSPVKSAATKLIATTELNYLSKATERQEWFEPTAIAQTKNSSPRTIVHGEEL
jgi:hypothetical protein